VVVLTHLENKPILAAYLSAWAGKLGAAWVVAVIDSSPLQRKNNSAIDALQSML
jgi:hypothetical protein